MGDAVIRMLRPVMSEDEAEQMRVIRNACREWMTHDQREITPEQQKKWFATLDRATFRPYLYVVDGVPVGYGIIRFEDRRWWVSGGLSAWIRGQGHGTQLFDLLANLVNERKETCWLTVFKHNVVAHRTYRSLGFVETGYPTTIDENTVVLTMRREPT